MSFCAFQYGFQAGFEVDYGSTVKLTPNGGRPYQPTSHELRYIEKLNKIEQLKLNEKVTTEDLKAKDYRIEELELERLREGLSDQRLQNELLQLMLERQQIHLMQLEYQRLLKELMEEDEAIMVILMTMPF